MHEKTLCHLLIIKLDHAGDVLWTTPALATLRQAFPAARLSYICAPYTRPVLENNPYLDDLISWSGGPFPEVLPRPDLAFCLDTRTPAVKLTYHSRAPIRTGYFYFPRGLSILWPLCLLTDPQLHPASRGNFIHEVATTHQLLEKFNCATAPVGKTSIFLSAAEEKLAQEILQQSGHRNEPLLGIHLPLKWLDGNWPPEHVIQLIKNLKECLPEYTLLVSCGPGEETLLQSITLHLPPGTLCIHGQSFRIWAAILKRCSLLICRDCGPVHVAAALNVPVISIFEESKRKEHTRWEPWMIPHVNVFRPDQHSSAAAVAFLTATVESAYSLLKKRTV